MYEIFDELRKAKGVKIADIRRLDVLENDDVNVYINMREKDEGKEASFRKLEG